MVLRRQPKVPQGAAPARGHISVPGGPSVVFDDAFSQVNGAAAAAPHPQSIQQARRPRLLVTPDAIEEAVKLTAENKVNTKNAWDIPLIEGMENSVQMCLAAQNDDQHAQFSKAASLVEGGAKVWSHRVDSTWKLSEQLVRRLLRNNQAGSDDEANEGENADERKKELKERRRKRVLERTIALNVAEINTDLRVRSQAASQACVSPLFRAMSEKFDQSSAHGLLLNNAPFGKFANVILDVDYARSEYLQRQPRLSGGTQFSQHSIHAAQLLSQKQGVDDSVNENIIIHVDRELEARLSGSSNTRLSGNASARNSNALPPLLLVPNHPEVQRELAVEEERHSAMLQHTRSSSLSQSRAGDDGGDDDGGNWDGDGGDDDYDDAIPPSERIIPDAASRSRMASEARDFASGVFSLSQQDMMGAALIAENPDWVALSQQAATGKFGFRNMGVVSTVRSQFNMRSSKVTSSNDPQQPVGPTAKRRRLEKTVSFVQSANDAERAGAEAADLKALKQLRDPKTVLSKLGMQLCSRDDPFDAVEYRKPDFTFKRAVENNLLLRQPFTELPSSEWLPPDIERVSAFFQPFSTGSPCWNLLCKTQSASQRSHGAFDRTGASPGNDDDVDMPADVFADDYDDYDDGAMDDGGEDQQEKIPVSARPSGTTFDPVTFARLSGLQTADAAVPTINFTEFASSDALAENDTSELMKVLRGPQQSMPTQVNVVELRRVMWNQTKRSVHATVDPLKDVMDHAAALRRISSHSKISSKRDNGEDDDDQDQDEETKNKTDLVKFSDIVEAVIPSVPTFSSTGTLSPAFFFFSILFLANEHGIVIENTENGDIADLVIKGLCKN